MNFKLYSNLLTSKKNLSAKPIDCHFSVELPESLFMAPKNLNFHNDTSFSVNVID